MKKKSTRCIWVILLLLSAATAACSEDDGADGGDNYEGDDPGECTDGVDNDRDGLFDCNDPTCANSASCLGSSTGTDSSTSTGTGTDSDSSNAGTTGSDGVDTESPDTTTNSSAASTDSPVVTDTEECGNTITMVIRDFSQDHPDFQTYYGSGASTGLVQDTLTDHKPIFKSTTGVEGGTRQITSAESFAQWYHTIEGVNQEFEIELPLTSLGGSVYEYENRNFFPLDDVDATYGFEGNDHNFHFTTEIHIEFTYNGGEIFTFSGDDDLWLFVDGKLALDLGGLHSVVDGEVHLDDLGLVPGHRYPLEIFHAERRTQYSNYHITTTIQCITSFVPEVE